MDAHEDEVIKADESKLLADVHVFPIARLQRTKGHHGVTGDNGGGLLLEQHLRAAETFFMQVAAVVHDLFHAEFLGIAQKIAQTLKSC